MHNCNSEKCISGWGGYPPNTPRAAGGRVLAEKRCAPSVLALRDGSLDSHPAAISKGRRARNSRTTDSFSLAMLIVSRQGTRL